MLSILRARSPTRRHTASQKTIEYEDGRCSQTFYGPSQEYFVQHVVPDSTSLMNPPPHIHFFQTEQFWIEKGNGVWYLPTAAAASQREQPRSAGQTIDLPMGTYHYFRNLSDSEPLVVRFRIDPRMDCVAGEAFFRNFFGYLDDCRREGSQPSIFQLQLFLHTVQSGIAVPVPGPDAVKWWVSRVFMLVLGVVIGEWVLGYRRRYPEYYSGQDTE